MALSEHEQRLLEEMERGFYQSEADVMEPRAQRPRTSVRSLVLGIVVVLVSVGVMIGGVAAQQLWLGLIGFAAMVGGVLLMLQRGSGESTEAAQPGVKQARRGGESLSERMERRWDDRMNGNNR